jgi:hypothetical protein
MGKQLPEKITTQFEPQIIQGLRQYQHDMGLPYLQDAIRILTGQALTTLGYPKKVHPVNTNGF